MASEQIFQGEKKQNEKKNVLERVVSKLLKLLHILPTAKDPAKA